MTTIFLSYSGDETHPNVYSITQLGLICIAVYDVQHPVPPHPPPQAAAAGPHAHKRQKVERKNQKKLN